jgi:hypothetical protein
MQQRRATMLESFATPQLKTGARFQLVALTTGVTTPVLRIVAA